MKKNLPLIIILAVCFIMHTASLLADNEMQKSFIQIKHIGEEDKPIPTVIITADASIAASFSKELNVRVHELKEEAFSKVDAFLFKKLEKGGYAKTSADRLMDFGSFEISKITCKGIKIYSFTVSHTQSPDLLGHFYNNIKEQKIDEGLTESVRTLLTRIGVKAQNP
jgi:hypothetical protein